MTVDLKLGEAQLTYRNCQWTSFMLDAFVTTTRLNEVVFDKLTKYVNACLYLNINLLFDLLGNFSANIL
jgi:hypothetical protein